MALVMRRQYWHPIVLFLPGSAHASLDPIGKMRALIYAPERVPGSNSGLKLARVSLGKVSGTVLVLRSLLG